MKKTNEVKKIKSTSKPVITAKADCKLCSGKGKVHSYLTGESVCSCITEQIEIKSSEAPKKDSEQTQNFGLNFKIG